MSLVGPPPEPMLPLGPHQSKRPALPYRAMVMSAPELWPRTMSGSVLLLQLGSVFLSMTCVTMETGMGELALMVWTLESWYQPLLALQPENSPPPSPTSSSDMDLGELAQSPPSKVLGDLFLSSSPLPHPPNLSPTHLSSCQRRAGPDAMGTEEAEGAVLVETQTDQIS